MQGRCVSDRSRGQEISLRYGVPWQSGATRLTPYVQASRWSAQLANYSFGTLDVEVARGVPLYRPDAINWAELGLQVQHQLGGPWLLGNLAVSRLPQAVRNSPLIEPDTRSQTRLLLAVSRLL